MTRRILTFIATIAVFEIAAMTIAAYAQQTRKAVQIQYLSATVERISVQQDASIVVRTTLSNTGRTAGIAVALRALYSDGIADFWKFSPVSEAALTDDVGSNYSLRSISGLGFARDNNDWAILMPGDTIGVTAIFSKNSQLAPGAAFDFSLPIRLVWYQGETGEKRASSFELYFRSIHSMGLR